MIVHNCEQGSSEWLRMRAGIPTASAFHLIVTKSGEPSTSVKKYMNTLLAERMMARPIDEHVSMWMQRGKDLEAAAVAYYEGQRNLDTVPVGFITNDAGTIGASPDRLVGVDGLVEIKVPAPHTHVNYLLRATVDDKYRPQAQGQLWIAEKRWVDLCSYHPEMPKALVRIERDEAFIKTLAKQVTAFSLELEAMTVELHKRGWIPDESRADVLEQLARSARIPRVEEELTFD